MQFYNPITHENILWLDLLTKRPVPPKSSYIKNPRYWIYHSRTVKFLRVYSPSAEVSGHGPEQEVLQTGKNLVNIHKIVPVGNYAIQLYFTDGHNTGLYSWDLLYRYGLNYEQMWQRYLQRMNQAGASREPANAVQSQSTTYPSCE